jgi:hypothetical protein
LVAGIATLTGHDWKVGNHTEEEKEMATKKKPTKKAKKGKTLRKAKKLEANKPLMRGGELPMES